MDISGVLQGGNDEILLVRRLDQAVEREGEVDRHGGVLDARWGARRPVMGGGGRPLGRISRALCDGGHRDRDFA